MTLPLVRRQRCSMCGQGLTKAGEIVVRGCNDCPYADWHNFICHMDDTIRVQNSDYEDAIPTRCPLREGEWTMRLDKDKP